jgi:hypothetical protein
MKLISPPASPELARYGEYKLFRAYLAISGELRLSRHQWRVRVWSVFVTSDREELAP